MVRAEGKRLAFAEIVIGPNQNVETARERLNKLLETNNYGVGDTEYPSIMLADLSPWEDGAQSTMVAPSCLSVGSAPRSARPK
jgi:hypothetical protein